MTNKDLVALADALRNRLTLGPARAQRRQLGFGAYTAVARLLSLFSTLCPIAIAQKAPATAVRLGRMD